MVSSPRVTLVLSAVLSIFNGPLICASDQDTKGAPPTKQAAQLTAQDHTLILSAVMRSIASLAKELDFETLRKDKKRPSGIEVLQALVRVKHVDSRTKARIALVLDGATAFVAVEPADPAGRNLKDALLKDLRKQGTPADKAAVLKSALRKTEYKKHLAVATGIRTALDIFDAGANTIYALRSRETTAYSTRTDLNGAPGARCVPPECEPGVDIDWGALGDLFGADAGGAVAGGMVGCEQNSGIGAPGCAAGAGIGAIRGAILASTGKAVSQVF
jgi:hypothetical protein